MATRSEVILGIRSDTSAIRKTVSELDAFKAKLLNIGTTIKAGFGLQVGAILTTLPARFAAATRAAIAFGSALNDSSTRLNIDVESLQVLQGLARDAGTSVEELEKNLIALRRASVEGARAGTTQARAFASLGLSAAQLMNLPLEQQLERVAIAIARSDNQAVTFNASLEIFGARVGPKMAEILQRLAARGFPALSEEIQRTYGILNKQKIKALDEMGDRLEQIKGQFQVLGAESVVELRPLIDAFVDLSRWVKEIAKGFTDIGQGIGVLAGNLAAGTSSLREWMWIITQGQLGDVPTNFIVPEPEAPRTPPPATDIPEVGRNFISEIAQIETQLLANRRALAVNENNEAIFFEERQRRKARYLQSDIELNQQLLEVTRERFNADRALLSEDERVKRYGEIVALQEKLSQLDSALRAAAGRPLGLQIARDFDLEAERMGTINERISATFVSVGDSIRTSLGTAFSDAILKAQSAKEALSNFGWAIAQSFVQATSQMVADWIYQHTVMAAVRRVFHVGGVIEKSAATAAETGIHAAGEAAQTGATVAGAGARGGIRLSETVFHGVQVGIRTVAHTVGEVTATGVTIAQKIIRIPIILAESAAWLVKAGISAMSAVAGIPFVGPILAIAALATIIGAGAKLLGGFETGGYTGNAGTSTPVGVVHGREYVFDADATRRIGVARLEALRFTGTLPGYALGGFVGPAPAVANLARSRADDAQESAATKGDTLVYYDRNAMRRHARTGLRADVISIIDQERHRWSI